MGFFDKLRGELIDLIEWTDPTQDTMVFRFERYGNEIKSGAKLTVRESQMAVFVNEGKFADVFPPGMYTLTTQNLPILSTLKGWLHGFNSPFKAEVYFVNTKNFTDQKWGTKNPITMDDPRFGMVEIRAFGTFAVRVIDPKIFLQEIVGTDNEFTTEEINDQLRSLIVTRFTDAAGESGLTIDRFASNTNELSQYCQNKIENELAEYGLKLTKFLIENISMPDEIKKEIHSLSRLGRVNAQQLAQMNAAKAIEIAAANPNGDAGASMSMGMGFGMAQQMAQVFGKTMQDSQPSTSAPPPIPSALMYFVAMNGQQTGPHNEQVLGRMVQDGSLKHDTLVWKQGMPAWTKAGEVNDLSHFFAVMPPPIPQ
ncbi:MAG: SPFH domain-containing protein [Nitrosomonas sp.]|uniref:SPFH domain-containing protein n=1 Tax=Nitrosomonas sp. TaxID=42353 RepID=UPI0032EF03C1